MDNHAPTPLPRQASIVFIRIQDFARRPVGEQAELKDRLERLVADVAALLPADGRIVLDALDGAAIIIPQRPELALDAADAAQKSAAALPFCIGINYGAIKAVSSMAAPDDPDATLVGDGLDTARAVAEFAKPGRYLTTRAFREVLKIRAPARVHALGPSGTFTDLRLRTHELFVRDARFARRRRLKLITFGVLGVAGILSVGVVVRMAHKEPVRPLPVPEPVQQAIIVFDIKPPAEVMLDGVVKGRTPPLQQLETSPGIHTLRITHGKFPPIELEMDLDEGEKATVKHVFAAGQKPPPRQRTYIEKLRQKWGL